MVRARYFAELPAQRLRSLTNLSQLLQPDTVFDLDELMKSLRRVMPLSPMPGTHFYANFGHLNGYSSNYYIPVVLAIA